jgi:hypothetical protein
MLEKAERTDAPLFELLRGCTLACFGQCMGTVPEAMEIKRGSG